MEGHLTTLHKDHIAWQGDEPHTRLGGMDTSPDERFSLTGLLKPIAHEPIHLQRKMRVWATIVSVSRLPLRCIPCRQAGI
jgi:hypothetical protein